MAKISKSNAVVGAVIEAAALYDVPRYRMNSRVVTVAGAGGRNRPMFFGEWTDDLGKLQCKGMADVLLTPQIDLLKIFQGGVPIIPMNQRADILRNITTRICVPLWVECKSGSGELSDEQKAFRSHVIMAGAFYLEIHDSADELLKWFEQMGVRR